MKEEKDNTSLFIILKIYLFIFTIILFLKFQIPLFPTKYFYVDCHVLICFDSLSLNFWCSTGTIMYRTGNIKCMYFWHSSTNLYSVFKIVIPYRTVPRSQKIHDLRKNNEWNCLKKYSNKYDIYVYYNILHKTRIRRWHVHQVTSKSMRLYLS